MNDTFGDRMKGYENMEAGRKFMPLLPIIARIDGRTFKSFTRGMNRPYDERMSQCMIETTRHLVDETGACMGYTQSDEITLAWHSDTLKKQVWFNGRTSKMISQLAAQATVFFYREVLKRMPEYADRMPTFDARVWNVPNREEGAACFLWREWDATKNSITMAASAHFSHKALHGKNGAEKQDMLMEKGINWNDYPAFFKRGTYIQRVTTSKPFTPDELMSLPPKHKAHTNPELVISRSYVQALDLPPLSKVANRTEVIFEGAAPVSFAPGNDNTSDSEALLESA
ncbi:tRNA(His) guanylyltransferase Thg1 family protein [Pseudomonas luteola]